MKRLEDKIHSTEVRVEELESERLEMQVWSQELFLEEKTQTYQSPEFRSQQGALFNKFHPDMVSC